MMRKKPTNTKFINWKILFSLSILVACSSCQCQYRESENLPLNIFTMWATWGCYIYNRPDVYTNQPIVPSICEINIDENIYNVPGLIIKNNCIPIHYSNKIIEEYIGKSFKNNFYTMKWKFCCQDAEICCKNTINMTISAGFCPSVWDGWSCFNPISADKIYKQICSKHAYTNQPPRCNHFSYKKCQNDGIWEDHTDYSLCDITPLLITRTQWNITLLVISIIICTPAVILLICVKRLQTQKLKIIRNLIISITLRYFFVLLVKITIIMDELTSVSNTNMIKNEWPCKMLSFFEKLSLNLVYLCMLLEAIFLHQLLIKPLQARNTGGPKMNYFNAIGLVIAIGSSVTWSITMAEFNDKNCWQITDGTEFSLILDVPRILMLLINVVLLIHIVYTLWIAFHKQIGRPHPSLRTVRAGLICVPVLGIPYLFLIVHPDIENCEMEQIFYIMLYITEALQGILVVSLHCYTDIDVKRTYLTFFENALVKFKIRKIKQSSVPPSIISTTVTTTADSTYNI